jgi:hypothetical protein
MRYGHVSALAHRGITALIAGATLLAGLTLLAALPLSSRGDDNVVGRVLDTTSQTAQGANDTVRGLTGHGAGRVSTRAPASEPQTPPPSRGGDRAHAQGTVASVDLDLGDSSQGSGLDTSGEEAVVGRSRGEQEPDGSYHGHVTIAALFGHELLGVDSTSGQSNRGPFQGIQNFLDQICRGSGGQICLGLLTAESSTTANGSSSRYSTLTAALGGPDGLNAAAGQSSGDISSDGDCQTSSATSRVANAQLAGESLANIGESSTSSTGCDGQTPVQGSSSSVAGLFGTGVPLPSEGCDDGTPNSVLSVGGVVATACNAQDDGQGAQPSGGRDALSAFVLPTSTRAAGTVRTAGTSSGASAAGTGNPGTATTPTGRNPTASNPAGTTPGQGETGTDIEPVIDSDPSANGGSGQNAAARTEPLSGAGAGSRLPFTGTDIVSMLIGGLLMLASGLGLRSRVSAAA